jgi:hypothetical protein
MFIDHERQRGALLYECNVPGKLARRNMFMLSARIRKGDLHMTLLKECILLWR